MKAKSERLDLNIKEGSMRFHLPMFYQTLLISPCPIVLPAVLRLVGRIASVIAAMLSSVKVINALGMPVIRQFAQSWQY